MKCLTFRTFISQLDEARRPGDDKQDDVTEQPDVADEDNAIEMTDDIDAKLHDLPPDDGNDDSDDDGEDDGGDDLDKQMGDLGDEQTNKLDEQVWGADDEDDDDVSTPLLNVISWSVCAIDL